MNRLGNIGIDKVMLGCLLVLVSIGVAGAACLDSDNGMNYFVKGSTNISRNINSYCLFNDKCYNNYILKEYYCYNGNIRYIYFNCGASGCSNGACSGTPQNLCTPGASQVGTCNVCNSAGTAYLNKCTASQVCSNGNCITPQVCTPGELQAGTQCNVCNSAGTSFASTSSSCPSGQTCNAGQCVGTPAGLCGNNVLNTAEQCDGTNLNGYTCQNFGFIGGTLKCVNCQLNTSQCTSTTLCTPNAVQSGTTCNVCNSAGTTYVPTNSKCPTGQTCNSAGACITSSTYCTPNAVQSGTTCNVCNSAGTAYVPTASRCSATQTCSAGQCLNNQAQTCTPGALKTGTTCFVCNSAGTAYVSDATKCSTGQCGLSGACLSAPASGTPGTGKQMWVIGYYPNWWWGTLDPQNLDWTGMTHMVLFTGSGISSSAPYFSSSGLTGSALTNTIDVAHSHGVKVLLSLASVYPGTSWNAIASDNSKIDTLVSTAVAFAQANNFDGIELDIEWPNAKAPHNYLMDKLRAALDAWPTRGILVSAIDMAPLHSAYDPVVMNRDIDIMFAMTYTNWVNCGGPVAGFGTPVYKSTQFPNLAGCTLNDDTIDFITQGYDPAKMAISVSFESIKFGGVSGVGSKYSSWGFYQARNDIRSQGVTLSWDDSAKASYYLSGSTMYDVQSPQSIAAVVDWAKQHNFGGMMAYDTPAGWLPSKSGIVAQNPLWEALVSAVNNPASGTSQYCTPNAVQSGTQCNVCNSAGTSYAISATACSGQACNSGMCAQAASTFCTPNAVQSGTACYVCNSAGSAYLPTASRCSTGQTCNSIGACVIDSNSTTFCTPNALQSGTQCNVCNSAGTAYSPTASRCSTGQSCNSAGACLTNPVCTAPSCNSAQYCLNGQWSNCATGQTCSAGACVSSVICTFGTTKTGTTCLSCNAAGTGYVVDSTKCASGQTCNSAGACMTSGTGTWNGGVPAGSTIPVAGGNYYLLGTNYPWISYAGDFGKGSITASSTYASDISKMKGYGAHVIRWWVFTNGATQPSWSGNTATGLSANFYKDMDNAIALAKQNNVYLVPVFFNGDIATSHSSLFDSGTNTDSFISNVVVPLMQHYPNEPRILAWEVFNEPEGAIGDGPLGVGPWYSPHITMKGFYYLTSKVCAAVHQYTTSYCTVGANAINYLPYYTDSYTSKNGYAQMNLDFYEAHYYGYGPSIYSTKYSSLGLDHPVVIGEVAGTSTTTANMDAIYNNGYAGYWPWAYEQGTISIPWSTFTAWANAHAAAINIPAAN